MYLKEKIFVTKHSQGKILERGRSKSKRSSFLGDLGIAFVGSNKLDFFSKIASNGLFFSQAEPERELNLPLPPLCMLVMFYMEFKTIFYFPFSATKKDIKTLTFPTSPLNQAHPSLA